MPSQSYQRQDDAQQFQSMFLQAVAESLVEQTPKKRAEIRERIEAETQSIVEANLQMVVDGPSRAHLAMTSLVLASYRVLPSVLNEAERLMDILKVALKAPFANLKGGFRSQLDTAANPHQYVVRSAKEKAEWYGATFAFEYEGDETGPHFFQNVKRCFYHSFFVANNAPQLTPVFCDWDYLWTEEIDPTRHGFRFERPTTLGYGGDMCRFQFLKVAPTGESGTLKEGAEVE